MSTYQVVQQNSFLLIQNNPYKTQVKEEKLVLFLTRLLHSEQHIAGDGKEELMSYGRIQCPKAMQTLHHCICTPLQSVNNILSRVKTM